jgi:SAM-dependent methyltransferase
MLRYYLWPLAEQVLSYTPGGRSLFHGVGRISTRRTRGRSDSFVTALPIVKRIRELVPTGATVMDVGTGWFHHVAFLVYLLGDYRLILFDVEDKAWLPYVRNYLSHLRERSALVARELELDEAHVRRRLDEVLELPTREAMYAHCGFEPRIVADPTRPFLPAHSVDCMVSNCVLVHIPPAVLLPELRTLRALLKPGGYMYHHLGHDDHWALHDPKMKWPSFKYMEYSERAWRSFFQTRLEYHNRLVKPEWIDIFRTCGLDIVEYGTRTSEESRRAIQRLRRIDARFQQHDPEDLAAIYSYVLLQPAAGALGQGPLNTASIARPDMRC